MSNFPIMKESLPESKANRRKWCQDGEIFQMHLLEHWIQLCLKPELLLGSLPWELINFLFGLSYLSIVSALATKKGPNYKGKTHSFVSP